MQLRDTRRAWGGFLGCCLDFALICLESAVGWGFTLAWRDIRTAEVSPTVIVWYVMRHPNAVDVMAARRAPSPPKTALQKSASGEVNVMAATQTAKDNRLQRSAHTEYYSTSYQRFEGRCCRCCHHQSKHPMIPHGLKSRDMA